MTGQAPRHAQPAPVVVEKTTLIVGAPMATAALSASLHAAGIRVLAASSAEEALGILLRHAVDCLITHTTLPGMSGADLLNELRRRNDPPALIIESSQWPSGSRARWLDAGAADCVDSRTNVDIITARCAAILRRYKRP